MVCKFLVISERPDEYLGKKGLVKNQRLILLDTDQRATFVNTFDYDMSDEEKEQYAGKLSGKTIEMGCTDFKPFDGRLRIRGSILEVVGGVTAGKGTATAKAA